MSDQISCQSCKDTGYVEIERLMKVDNDPTFKQQPSHVVCICCACPKGREVIQTSDEEELALLAEWQGERT